MGIVGIGRSYVPLAAAIFVAACSAQQCDPGSAGFFGGVGCAAGGYQARNAQYNSDLQSAQNDLAAAQRRNQAAQQRAQATHADLLDLQRQLAIQEGEQETLRSDLDRVAARRNADAAKVAHARAELAVLHNTIERSRDAPNAQTLEQLRQRQAKLRALIEAM